MFNGSLCSVWEFPWGSDGLSDAYSCREREALIADCAEIVCTEMVRGGGVRRAPSGSSKMRSCRGPSVLPEGCSRSHLHVPLALVDCPWLTAFPARCCQSTRFADLTVGKLCLITSFAFPVLLRNVSVALLLPLVTCCCSYWPGCIFLINFWFFM